MPSIKISKKGKIENPVTKKLLVINTDLFEINLEKLEIVTDIRAFCVMTLTEHYVANPEKYGSIDNFMKIFSKKDTRIEIETDKGNILGAKVNSYFLNQLRECIKGLIILNDVRDGKYPV